MDTIAKKDKVLIKDWAEADRPREKLRIRGGAALSNAELIAIILQTGTPERSALDLATDILMLGKHSLAQLGKLALKDMQVLKGIGEAKAIMLSAALELGRRRQVDDGLQLSEISNSRSAADILVPLMCDLQHEKFCVLCLSAMNKLIHWEFVSSGGLTSTVVDPKIIFKVALQHMSSRIIIAHNHPSGNLQPSRQDRQITTKIKEGAALLDIQLMDHIIVGDNRYCSFADEGWL